MSDSFTVDCVTTESSRSPSLLAQQLRIASESGATGDERAETAEQVAMVDDWNTDVSEVIKSVPNTKITVMFCIPGRTFSDKFFMAWTGVLSEMIKSDKYEVAVSNKYSSHPNIARAMCLGANVLAGPDQLPFQGTLDYDVLVWLDPDILFNFSTIEHLIESCLKIYPVVSGVYSVNGGNQLSCVPVWNTEYYSRTGTLEYMTTDVRNELMEAGKEWIKCAYSSMGCMAIRKGIIEDSRLKYPWFFRDIQKIPSVHQNIPYITDDITDDVCFIRNLIDKGIIDFVLVSLNTKFGREKITVY